MRNLEKVMIALPNDRWFGNRHWHNFPYTFGLLNATLKDKYDVKYLDAGFEDLTPDETKERIRNYNPDIIGISCMSMEYAENFKEMASIAKSACPNSIVIEGGIFPTTLPKVSIQDKNIDYIVMGEGEHRLPKLLEFLKKEDFQIQEIDGLGFRSNGKMVIQPIKNYIQNLDSIPSPSYEGIDFDAYANKGNKYNFYTNPRRYPYALTISSRGCPFNCIFCSSKSINGPKIRYRSADNVLKEIDWLVREKGIKEVIFLDDNLYLNKPRINRILDGLIERKHNLEWKSTSAAVYALDDRLLEKMRKSGCYQISLAVESGTPEGLKIIRKPGKILENVWHVVEKAKSLDFNITAMFVIGNPGETWEQIRKSFQLGEGLDVDYCAFSISTPLPNTELYRIVKERNLLPHGFDFNTHFKGGFSKANITTEEFTSKELQILRAFEWDRINFKTDKKIKKIAEICGLTVEEVKQWRVSTRRSVGVNVKYNE